jgi:penicillin-binding protein 1A
MADMEDAPERQEGQQDESARTRAPLVQVRVGDVVDVRIVELGTAFEARYRVAILPRNVVQAALLCMDVRTGEIKAMVGGRDFKSSEFNRATQAKRQPGSAFKPLIYTAAFDKGLTAATVMVDEPISFSDPVRGEWRPRNSDREFHGPMTLRSALVHSRNIITIKVLQQIGVDYAAGYAANMGISSPIAKNLSMALGTSVMTVQEMVRAFGVLANGGKRVEPYFIKRIVDRTGNVFEHYEPREEQVIDPRIAYLTTSILQDAVQRGTGTRARLAGRPVAGKTGTTDDQKDAWFVGFTPSLVTGVWVGFDDGKPLGRGEMGGVAAAPIWAYFMDRATAGKPVENFEVPSGIVTVRVDPRTGQPAGLFSDGTNEVFLDKGRGGSSGGSSGSSNQDFRGGFRNEP